MRTPHHGWRKARCRIAAIVVLEFLTVLSLAAVCAIPARADIALMSYLDEGVAVHNGTHICMPEAHVRVNITWDGGLHTSMRAEFHLFTNTTQNTTVGFVPPELIGWGEGHTFHLAIDVNGSEMDYAMLNWSDLGVDNGFTTELVNALGTWLEEAQYAVFNIELQANSTSIISVTSSTSQVWSYVNWVGYNYIVASARTFEGDTHEVVHMELIEESPFLNVSFWPNSCLTLTKEGIQTDAIWDFNVSEFQDDTVSMHATVQEYHGSGKPINLDWLFLSIEIIVIIAIVVILYRKRG
jgi:hypothetical protein